MDLSQKEWAEKINDDPNAIILDVRREEELEEEGFIHKAVNHDFQSGSDFIKNIEALDKSKNYYVYCRSGNRSGQACKIMNQLGIDNTFNLLGGFMEWEGEVDELY